MKRWFEKVLNELKSKYKFAFIHHLVRGIDSSARGGQDRVRSTEEYGYKSGVFLPPAGYIRVKVEPAEATVDYIRTIMPQNKNETRKNGQSFHQFKIR